MDGPDNIKLEEPNPPKWIANDFRLGALKAWTCTELTTKREKNQVKAFVKGKISWPQI